MVFPIGAHTWEPAVDHLDRLPGKSLIDRLVHQRRVAKDDDAARAEQPRDGGEGRGDQTDGNGDDGQAGVQLRRGGAQGADLEVASVELANEEHADGDEDDVEEQPPVGKERVDAEHDEDDGIVARVVAQIVVDTRLQLGKVLGLVDALDVQELRDGTQVREPASQGSRAHAGKAILKAEAGRQGVQGDLYTRHGGFLKAERGALKGRRWTNGC